MKNHPLYFLMTCVIFAVSSTAFAQSSSKMELLDEQGRTRTLPEGGEYVPNECIVQFLPNSIMVPSGLFSVGLTNAQGNSEVLQLLHEVGADSVRKVFRFKTDRDTIRMLESGQQIRVQDLSQVFVVSFPLAVDVPMIVKRFKESKYVLYAEPNYIVRAEDIPNDPEFYRQWGLKQSSNEDINAPAAWAIQKGSYNIKIGIFDTGIDYVHDDLGNAIGLNWKVVGGWDWVNNDSDPRDDNFHGTHVAGISGALTNNLSGGQRVGIAGVAGVWDYDRATNTGNKGAQLFAMKVLGADGRGSTEHIADAVVEGADPEGGGWGYGIHVLNLSLGSYSYSETFRNAVNYAARMGRVFVAAKGNDNTSNSHYPSDYDGSWVISVGATSRSGSRASFSNYGNGIDVVAPGVNIYASTPTYTTSVMSYWGIHTDYDSLSGTSMATPHVSGLAALLFSQRSDLHHEDVQGIIRASADDKGDPGYDDQYGAGRIDAARALQYLQSPWALNRYSASGGYSVGNTGTYTTVFYNTGGALATGVYIVKRYDVRKSVSLHQYINTPYVWGRGANASSGWSAASPNYETGYCNVTSSTATSAELQTFVFEVWDIAGYYLGWYPAQPQNATFAYSVLGIPVTAPVISGFTQSPVPIYRNQSGTVTCNLSQGTGNISYGWTASYVPSSVYVSFSGNRAYIDNGFARPVGPEPSPKGEGGGGNDPTGLFRLTCTASNGAGSSTGSFYPFLVYTPPPPPPGGCPFVYAWRDSEYVTDNNILPQSQLPENEGQDVTDYYQLFVTPSLEEDKYILAVGEFENEHSFLDQTKLLVIDHDPDAFVTVDDSGTVIQFAKPAVFANAELDSTDVLKYLQTLDDVKVEAAENDTMKL